MHTLASEAIIMRAKEFGESDLLVTFFTPGRGRLKGVAKGARRSRRRFVNSLDIFSLVRLEYAPRGKGDLFFIHSGKLIESFPGIRTNFSTLSSASYMAELTEILFPWELPDPLIFEALKKSFHMLAAGKRADLAAIVFEIMAMSRGGYAINLEKCCVCGRKYSGEGTAAFRPKNGGIACIKCQNITANTPLLSPATAHIISRIQSGSMEEIEENPAMEGMIGELDSVLRLHREYHLGQRPRTANYLKGSC